ncbi:MAG: response regulator [Deltaproteobacteria bacterium]|nr:response regulator [Deltaproteobacteria bacterium]
MSKIQVKEFIQGISSAIMPLVEKKNLPLKVDVDEDIVMYADADKLRQILVNLLGNAAKFTDKGGIGIRARVEAGRVHDHVIIEVKDTGIGMPHDALEHIFDPFRQVDGSSTREHAGTGLGLNICTKLVNLMGGKIEVESESGKGSTFTLTLNKDRRSRLRPTQDEWQKKVRDALLQETEVAEKAPEAKEKETRSILIVDDDPVVIRELKIIFKEKDYRISFALTGSEGLRRIRAEVPDLILLDLRMPGMDGFKVLEELQKSEEIKNVPVMIITAADLSKAEARALGKNVKGVITKGRIDKSALLGRIDDILHIARNGVRTGDQVVEKAEKKATGKGPAKILVAEDRPDNMTLIKETLRPTGYKVYTASNGKEAVETAKKEKPDLILMDMQMPVMSGFEATKHIREIEELEEVPIIGLTARAMKGNEEEVLAAGCSDYLSKPMMPKDLVEKVEAWLGK